MSFGTFFIFQKELIFFNFLQKLDPCSRGGPVPVALDARAAAVKGPYCSCGGAVCPVYCRWSGKSLAKFAQCTRVSPP